MWRRSTASIPASVGGLPATHASTMISRRYLSRKLSGRRFITHEPLRLGGVALAYAVQSVLYFAALRHVSAPAYQVLSQTKVVSPRFWHAQSDPTMDANIQAFASRFGVNDPLRTCDMKQTLDAFLHYAWRLAITEPGQLDCLSWRPIRVPWE